MKRMAAGPMRRGEVWWADAGAAKIRPVVLVSRDEAYQRRQLLLIAPVTTRVRGLRSEVPVGEPGGLARPSVANCDAITTISKRMLRRRAGVLGAGRTADLDEALKFALGIE